MASTKRKIDVTTYILPVLFCALLIVLALVRNQRTESPVKAVLQAEEPLTLTEQAIENYLYSAGFTLQKDVLLDADGQAAGTFAAIADTEGAIGQMILRFSVPTYYAAYEIEGDSAALSSRKAQHEAGVQRGKEMFLALFDAIAATDGRVDARRDSAVEKLEQTINSGKAAAQSANSWRFSFSLEPGPIDSAVTILLEKVK